MRVLAVGLSRPKRSAALVERVSGARGSTVVMASSAGRRSGEQRWGVYHCDWRGVATVRRVCWNSCWAPTSSISFFAELRSPFLQVRFASRAAGPRRLRSDNYPQTYVQRSYVWPCLGPCLRRICARRSRPGFGVRTRRRQLPLLYMQTCLRALLANCGAIATPGGLTFVCRRRITCG